jgi:tRNA threonylcarbamoyladenosine biosynthesis protein TsaB
MKTILALDTSSENCSVALSHHGQITQKVACAPRNHTRLILPMIQTLLAEHALNMSDVDALAFGCGPGSFTGIRIAAGIAQGLAFGLDKPVYAISNLQALALQSYLMHGHSRVLATIDARMGEIYWGLFDVQHSSAHQDLPASTRYSVRSLMEEQVSAPQQLVLPDTAHCCAIGSGLSYMDEFPDAVRDCLSLTDESTQPEASAVARLCATAIRNGQQGDIEYAFPSYVRDSVAWNKLPGRA